MLFNTISSLLMLSIVVSDQHVAVRMDRTEYFQAINVKLSWTINIDIMKISLEIIAPIYDPTAWVAIGLSDTGGMKGADIALISLYHDTIYDLHSNDFVLPLMDKVQNWELKYLSTFDNYTIVQIERDLLTCDAEDFDINQHVVEHQVMIAYNLKDELLASSTYYKLNINQHKYSQRKRISLFYPSMFQPTADIFSNYIDFVFPYNMSASAAINDTSQYFCTMFNISKQINAIGIGVVDSTGSDALHHVHLFSCPDKAFDPIIKKCGSSPPKYDLSSCSLFFPAASPKSKIMPWPTNLFYKMPPGLYAIEVQFELAEREEINMIGSGMRIFSSESERESQIGILRVSIGDFSIPPQQKEYQVSGAMHSECTNKFVAEEGIDIISIGVHMHELGESVRVDLIRYPDRVQTIFEIKQWDFDRQWLYPVHYKLFPNDTLRIHCTYNSEDKYVATKEGLSMNNEQCQVNFGYVEKMEGIHMVYAKAVSDENTILHPSYCGSSFVRSWDEVKKKRNANNVFKNVLRVTASNTYLQVIDNRYKFCPALIFEAWGLVSNSLLWRLDLPYITLYPAIVILLGILFAFNCVGRTLELLSPGIYLSFLQSEKDRRKINIYVFSPIFFTLILALLIFAIVSNATEYIINPECEIIFNQFKSGESYVTYPYGLTVAINLVLIYFCVELIYRFNVNWDLFLHHLLTILILILLTTTIQMTINLTLIKIAYYWMLQVALEQPVFIALFIRKLKLNIVSTENYPQMFYFAVVWHYMTKVTTSVIVWYYYVLMVTGYDWLDPFADGDCDKSWYLYDYSYSEWLKYDEYSVQFIDWKQLFEIALPIISVVLFVLQMYQGYAFYKLGKPRTQRLFTRSQYSTPNGGVPTFSLVNNRFIGTGKDSDDEKVHIVVNSNTLQEA